MLPIFPFCDVIFTTMNIEEYESIVKETFLTSKPAEGSGMVAAASLLVLAGFSLFYWSHDASGIALQLPANSERVLGQGQYWRLVTSIFVHSDCKHLLSNSVGIGFLGYLLYGYFGCKVYPCLVLVTGAAVTLITVITYPANTNLLGASGVVYLMAAFWLTLYICLERRFSIAKRIIRAMGFMLIVLVPTSFSPEVSYRAHAIGFGMGILIAVPYFLWNKARFRQAEIIEIETKND